LGADCEVVASEVATVVAAGSASGALLLPLFHIVERVEMHGREVGRIIVRHGAAPLFESYVLGATKDATKDATHEVDGCGEYAQHNDPLNQSHYVHSSACSCVAPPEGRADRITLLARYA